jgi:hypothetical protein
MPLNDHGYQESVPTDGGDSPPAPDNRFCPPRLSRASIAFLQRSLAHSQHRRSLIRARHLQVCWDGARWWQVDLKGNVHEPFRVPLSASYLEISADDAEGTLLLAVFPLPAPTVVEEDGALYLSVTLEGAQTVAIAVVLGEGTGGDERVYMIQITYAESAAGDPPGAEPSVIAGLLAGPRAEPSTLRQQ